MWDGAAGLDTRCCPVTWSWLGQETHQDGEELWVLVAAAGELWQSPVWTPAVSAPDHAMGGVGGPPILTPCGTGHLRPGVSSSTPPTCCGPTAPSCTSCWS